MTLFVETVALPGTYTAGGTTVTVTKARQVSKVYSVQPSVGTGTGVDTTDQVFRACAGSESGQSFKVRCYIAPSGSSGGPLAELANGANFIDANILVIYEGD